ncbi:NfeD family protein [candidate division KSB1 bacterium]|nr:NfeD family protein [candidate division KSB1 bacterium]
MMVDSLLQSGLAWFLLGAVLLIIELTMPGILAIFFAAGAWITAILLWTGMIGGTSVPIAVFLVVSVVSLIFLRKRLAAVVGRSIGSDQDSERALDDVIGKSAMVVESVDTSAHTGQVEFRGTNWSATAGERIEAGSVVEIVARHNLTLKVRPLGGSK